MQPILNFQRSANGLRIPVHRGNYGEQQREEARNRLFKFKNSIREFIETKLNAGERSLSERDFFTNVMAKMTGRGPTPEQIAARLSFIDCAVLYTYYFDLVTRDDTGHADNAYGAGFLAQRVIENDLKDISDPDCISASKLCAVASMVLYDKAIKTYHWDEYVARRFFTRDTFMQYHSRLGYNRLTDGEITSTYWSDVRTLLANNQNGWTDIMADYRLSEEDHIDTPTELVLWWRQHLSLSAESNNYYLSVIHELNKTISTWKLVCFIGFLKRNHILEQRDAEGDLIENNDIYDYAYTQLFGEYLAYNHTYDAQDKLFEYAEQFELSLKYEEDGEKLEEYAVGIVLRESFDKSATTKGELFTKRNNVRPKIPLKTRILMAKQNPPVDNMVDSKPVIKVQGAAQKPPKKFNITTSTSLPHSYYYINPSQPPQSTSLFVNNNDPLPQSPFIFNVPPVYPSSR